MRGMLEDEMTDKRTRMMKELQEENKRMALAKKQKETQWKDSQQSQNKSEISIVDGSDLMTENPATTTSMHGGHRYVPYHFKGLTPEQKASIIAEREQQLRDNRAQKAQETEEERQWALQQDLNRQIMMQNEQELEGRKKQMVEALKTQHKADKI
jgi:hypothetical protein